MSWLPTSLRIRTRPIPTLEEPEELEDDDQDSHAKDRGNHIADDAVHPSRRVVPQGSGKVQALRHPSGNIAERASAVHDILDVLHLPFAPGGAGGEETEWRGDDECREKGVERLQPR